MARTIIDVATYILERTGTVTTMKLQKLAFYSQAQHLAQYGSSLFPEDFEAWRGGPVAPELYALHRGMFLIRPGELPSSDSSTLTDAERGLIDSVCSALGGMTGAELSERTHLESPWLDAREGLAPSDPSNAVITQEAMHSYYLEHPVLLDCLTVPHCSGTAMATRTIAGQGLKRIRSSSPADDDRETRQNRAS